MQPRLIANFLLFQLGWLVTVVGAARGYPFAGIVYAGVWATFHHWQLRSDRWQELRLVLASAGFGFVVDSALVLGGAVAFPDHAQLGYPSTIWMACLWLMFAMTLRHSLGWLRNRYTVAAVLGAVFGPLAYWAGDRLDAIQLNEGILIALAAIGVAWLLSMLCLVKLEIATRAAPAADPIVETPR